MRLPQADWSRWLVASAIALAVTALVVGLFRMPRGVDRAPGPTNRLARPVTLAPGTDSLLNEEAMLRDPTPLFLPTKWNAAENALRPEARRETSGAFQSYSPALKFAGAELKLDLPAAVVVPSRPADAFGAERSLRPLAGFGQSDWQVAPLAPRVAFVKVTGSDGRVVFSRPIEDAQPPSESTWQPLEFLIAVDETGIVRPPVLTESSRVAAVDGYFEDFLAKGLHIGERLAPGFYRVSVGP
jgi:hypothetical protein